MRALNGNQPIGAASPLVLDAEPISRRAAKPSAPFTGAQGAAKETLVTVCANNVDLFLESDERAAAWRGIKRSRNSKAGPTSEKAHLQVA